MYKISYEIDRIEIFITDRTPKIPRHVFEEKIFKEGFYVFFMKNFGFP